MTKLESRWTATCAILVLALVAACRKSESPPFQGAREDELPAGR